MSEIKAMTIKQLKQYASDNGVDIGGLTKKSDIIEAIMAARNAKQPVAVENPKSGVYVYHTLKKIAVQTWENGEVVAEKRCVSLPAALKLADKLRHGG